MRDALACGQERLDDHHPRALDLTAEILVAKARELRGCVAAYADTIPREHFSQMLHGERTMPLPLFVSLVTRHGAEAHSAVQVALDLMQLRLTKRVSINRGPLVEAAEAVQACSTLQLALCEALSDNRLTKDERQSLLADVSRAQSELADVAQALVGAE